MLQASFEHAEEDKQARQLAELRLDAWQLLEGLRSALEADGEALLNVEEREVIDAEMAALQGLIDGDDAAMIREKTDALGRLSEAFATRRMDKSIREALAGVSLDELDGEATE